MAHNMTHNLINQKIYKLVEELQRRNLLKVENSIMLYIILDLESLVYIELYQVQVTCTCIHLISGVHPIDLLAEERYCIEETQEVNIQERKLRASQKTHQKKRRLIPNVEEWLNFKHRISIYYTTHALTGHGLFRTFFLN